MIQINTLLAEGFQGEFYKIHFQQLGFLLFPKPDLSNLMNFSRSQQRELGRIGVRFNLTSLLKFPHFFKDINFILLTDSQQVLLLPFLIKNLPQVTIIATSLSYQLAKISLEAFQQRLSDFDITHQDIDFFQESTNLDRYQERLNISFEVWRNLYSKKDIASLLSKVIKVNHYQIYDTERGVKLRSLPSGKNNGACVWELESVVTQQKVLLINEIALFNWRTCQACNLERLKESHQQNPYNLILFTKKALESFSEGQESRLADVIRKINSNASMGISTSIVLDDPLLCIDLIPRLQVQPEGKIRHILLGHNSMHHLHNYVNSYADYLSQHYKDQLFSDSPDYPLIQYAKLREKGILLTGTLEELSINKKLPLKEIVLQSHPFVRFIKNYEHYLEVQEEKVIIENVKHNTELVSLRSNFGSSNLQEFIEGMSQVKMVCFSQTSLPLEKLQFSKKHQLLLGSKMSLYLMSNNFKTKKIQSFSLVNNELELETKPLKIVKIPKNWSQKITTQLISKGISVEEQKYNKIKTDKTQIEESRGEIIVRGKSPQQMIIIGKYFESLKKEWNE